MADDRTNMARGPQAKVRAGKKARGFLRDRKGATAVEFALVAVPFFWLMCGLAENGLIFYTQSNLDFAMMETQREIRTGQVQVQNLSKDNLKTLVCNKMTSLGTINCPLNLSLDVRSFPDFAALDAPNVTTGDKVDEKKLSFSPGDPSNVVLVRGYYTWSLITPIISKPMANLGTKTRLLASTALFVNEPYSKPSS